MAKEKRKRQPKKVLTPHEKLAAIHADIMAVGAVLWANGDTEAAAACKASADTLPMALAK